MAVKTGVPIESLDLVVGAAGAGRGGEGLGRLLAPQWREPQAVHHRFGPQVPCDRERDQMPGRRSLRAPRRDAARPRGSPPAEGSPTRTSRLIRQVLTPGVWSRVVKLPLADDGDGAAAAVARAGQGRRHGAARGRDRHLGSSAGTPCQSDGDQARDQLDQAGRAGLQLLAGLPGLRRQEPGQAGLPS